MQKDIRGIWLARASMVGLAFSLAGPARGATESVLYNFAGGQDGANPVGALVADSQGRLFGVTLDGGNQECNSTQSRGCGTVFELSPTAAGAWSEQVIHVFSQASDGGQPLASPLIDAAGRLYGSTQYYGPGNNGTLWQLAPASGGAWSASILHTFRSTRKGFWCTGLTFDVTGDLYGVAYAGGTRDDGLLFHLAQSANGKWSDTVLYDFTGSKNDGNAPAAAPLLVGRGDLYGTTYEGGPFLTGTVYHAHKTSSGWVEAPIYIFQGFAFGGGSDGANPTAALVMDGKGNLFGTTQYGGASEVGTVYELSPDGNGGWTEKVIYTFTDGADGGHPSELIIDDAGNLYGVTSGHQTAGSVYKLSPRADGSWQFTVLYDFQGGVDGSGPTGLIRDAKGNLYGATLFGGSNDLGVIFEITP